MIPAIALACGAVVKTIVNLTLIPIIGVYGAPIGSLSCLLTAMLIELWIFRKNIKLELNYMQTIVKPVILCAMMGMFSLLLQKGLAGVLPIIQIGRFVIRSEKSATILAIIFAVVFYLVGLIWAKILDKNDYYMLPYGEKIYNFLKRIKLVKPTND